MMLVQDNRYMKSPACRRRGAFLCVTVALAIIVASCGTKEWPDGGGTLEDAVSAGDLRRVQKLLARGADVNAVDEYGRTPMHRAAGKGYGEFVELLIARGANINAADSTGVTPLHQAILQGKDDVVRLLISHGANVNTQVIRKSGPEATPLHDAIGRSGRDIVQLLLDHGASLTATDIAGRRPIDVAMEHRDVQVVKALVAAGDDVTLPVAAYLGDRLAVASLIEGGADATERTRRESTALHYAASAGAMDIVRLLLDRGADINAEDDLGRTPLYEAVSANHPDVVQFLMAHGTVIGASSEDGITALHIAADRGSRDVAQFLIARGAEVNARDAEGYTPLHLAAYRVHEPLVRLLLAHGADAKAVTNDGLTPMHGLAHADFQKWYRDNSSGGPLWIGKDEPERARELRPVFKNLAATVAGLLLDHGADINARDSSGETPLGVATRRANKEIAEVLRRHEAKK